MASEASPQSPPLRTSESGGGGGAPPARPDYARLLSPRAKALTLVGVLLGLFLAALDQTIVATALPRIVAELSGIDLLAWTATAYLLASTTMVPIYGKLSDIYGRKAVLLSGVVLFLAASALCGLAGSMLTLVVFRGLQGLGAAALTSTAFAIPADLFAPAERPRYQGIFGAVFGLSSVIGPFLGGYITDHVGWRWVFYVNLPLGAVALAAIILFMPKLDSGQRARVDYAGAVALVAAVTPLLLGLTLDKTAHPWTSPLVLGLFAGSLAALAALLAIERRAASPILPLPLFKQRAVALLTLVSVVNGAAFFGAILFLSIFMVNVLGVSNTRAGTALIPLSLAIFAGNLASSIVVQRIGRYKPVIVFGFALAAVGFYLVSRLGVDATVGEVRLRMVVLGLGFGPALPLLNLAIQLVVPPREVGVATASRQFFQQIGSTIGAAVFGVVLTTTLTASLERNLAPLRAQMPPAMAARLDPAQLRNGRGGEEGGAGDAAATVEQRITLGIRRGFAAQRARVERALAGDAQARAELLADPRLPPPLRGALAASADDPRGSAAGLTAGLAAAEQQALAQGARLGRAVDAGLRAAFAEAVTRIYRWAIPLMVLALLLMLAVPEVPLGRRAGAAPVSTGGAME